MYMHVHICAHPAASVFAVLYVDVTKNLCNIYTCTCTGAQNTCSKVHATLTAKNAYIHIHTHICIHIHMRTNTHAHP